MPQRSEAEMIAVARAAYHQMQDEALERSPLGAMAEWVASGRPPSAETLRAAGLRCDCPDPKLISELGLARRAFVRKWGFSIPCAEVVNALSRLSHLLEIGAGAGYWTALLQAAGLDVVATDPTATGDVGYGFTAGRYARIEPLAADVAVTAYPERDVFCSFPTQGEDWPLAAARALPVGRTFALIGEPRGGQTGTLEFHDFLDASFELVGAVDLPQFPRVPDRFTLHRRVR